MKNKPIKLGCLFIIFLFVFSVFQFNNVANAYKSSHNNLLLNVPSQSSCDSCKVTDNIYAFVGEDQYGYGRILTKNINDVSCIISQSNISSYLFDTQLCVNPHIISLGNNYFAIVYSGFSYIGIIRIIFISNSGLINTISSTKVFYYSCSNVDRNIFFDDINNILILSIENETGRAPILITLKYDTSNHIVSNIDSTSLYSWNSTVHISKWGTHATIGQTQNVFTKYYAMVNTMCGVYSNVTGITFNITSNGIIEICKKCFKYISSVGVSNYTSSIISRTYADKNFICCSFPGLPSLYTFSIINQTGQIQYVRTNTLSVVPHTVSHVYQLFKTSSNTLCLIWDWLSSSSYIPYLSNYSIDGSGVLTYVSYTADICDDWENGVKCSNFNILRMTTTGKYLFTYYNSLNGNNLRIGNIFTFFPSFTPIIIPPINGQSNKFYINLIDGSTNTNIIGILQGCFIGPVLPLTNCISITSNLWDGYRCNELGTFNNPFEINNILFNDGSYNWLNISCFKTTGINYENYSQRISIYNGNTYNILLYPSNYATWENEQTFTDSNGKMYGIRTDKHSYEYPEQIRIQYLLPDANYLVMHNTLHTFYIDGWNTTDFLPKRLYYTNCNIYGQWTDSNPYSPIKPSTGYQRISFMQYLKDVFNIQSMRSLVYIDYYDISSTFNAHGNITSIIPISPIIGDDVKIVFNANNYGNITITDLGINRQIYNQQFFKPIGNTYVTYNFNGIGSYKIDLYVYDGLTLHRNDTKYIFCNGSGNDFQDWGYKTEYLTVEESKLISGHDYLVIFYKSKINYTEIRIKSPSGSYMPFGTTISNTTAGTFTVFLASWLRLGEYNVTMNSSHGILFDRFNIIAEENNYVEFIKNSYAVNDTVTFYIRHSNKRVKIILLKDNIPYGSDILFDNSTSNEGIIEYPDKDIFTPGIWEVQLWETNNWIPHKLLSSDTAIFTDKVIQQHNLVIPGIEFSITPPLSYIIAITIIIILILLPSLIIRNNETILSFVSFILGLVGFIVCILIGLLPSWTISVIFIGGIIVIVVMWLQRKVA